MGGEKRSGCSLRATGPRAGRRAAEEAGFSFSPASRGGVFLAFTPSQGAPPAASAALGGGGPLGSVCCAQRFAS